MAEESFVDSTFANSFSGLTIQLKLFKSFVNGLTELFAIAKVHVMIIDYSLFEYNI